MPAAAYLSRAQSKGGKHEDALVRHLAGDRAPGFSLSRSSLTFHLVKRQLLMFFLLRSFLFKIQGFFFLYRRSPALYIIAAEWCKE